MKSGCALPSPQHKLGGLVFHGGSWASATVELLHDGATIGQGAFKPTFKTAQPNGPGYEPTCRVAPAAALAIFTKR